MSRKRKATVRQPSTVLETTSTTYPPNVLNHATLTERDMQRISELLGRFSQFTQQFEREEEATHDNHSEHT
jgi:hypothetical protein